MPPRRRSFDPLQHPGLFDFIDSPAPRAGESEASPAPIPAAADPLAPILPPKPRESVRFISFGSGSSGNCAYVGYRGRGILIDAGIHVSHVTAELRRHSIDLHDVEGIILTHDHGDHTRYAYTILRLNRHMRLWCTPRAFNGILHRHSVSRRIRDYHVPIYKEIPFRAGGFIVTPFEVMHDGSDNVGFSISHPDAPPGFNMAVATDLGCISPRAEFYLRQARHLMLESNYDAEMLRRGPYPEYLKARIAADNGHLDNAVTAAYLRSVWSPALRSVFLCHLSHDNNSPDIALAASSAALTDAGAHVLPPDSSPFLLDSDPLAVRLVALPRHDPSPLFLLPC